jgi:hypothetical protein
MSVRAGVQRLSTFRLAFNALTQQVRQALRPAAAAAAAPTSTFRNKTRDAIVNFDF